MFAIFVFSMVAGVAFILVLTVKVATNLARARRKELEAAG